MQNLKSAFAALLFSTVCLLTAAHAQITPSADTYTNSVDPTTNYGSTGQIEIDGSTSDKMLSYIQFDLASIPSGASISQATLKLYVSSISAAGSFDVDYVGGSWMESTLDAASAPTTGPTIASEVALTAESKNQYILIDVTPAVTAWLNGTEPNNGIVLVPDSAFFATFDSKENTTTSHPAELDIVFAGSGGAGTITGITTAAGSGLSGGGTSGTLNLSLTNSCAASQVLEWSGSAWVCSSAGTGTVTGITAGTDLTGGGTSGNVILNLNTATVPLLAAANTFTGNQTVNGSLTANGVVSGSHFEIGGTLFGFGTSTAGNAFLGFAGNLGVTGTSDTGTGFAALHGNTSGSGNTADGYEALEVNTTGSGNTATGIQTLSLNTTGANNNAIGAYALLSNTTGGSNNAVGNSALYTNNVGNNNNAVGYEALYSNTSGIDNDASGAYALYTNTTGLGNEASGEGALYANTTGNHNTAVGFNSLFTSATGSNNTGLGYGAGTDSTTTALDNATAVGAWADVAESNAVVLGSIQGVNGCLSTNPIPCLSAKVGIGTNMPGYTLDVEAPSGSATVNFGSTAIPATVTVNGNSTLTGNLTVTGTVSKGGGSFKIDDPLDPANKYLYHSFVESPDMMDVYNGNITTNTHGLAVVVLPDYFEALNRDFRYQLTVIGQFAQAIVAREISHNRFTIKTNRPGVKVSWQVTGIRHDAYANAHRIPTEENKTADEQGRYLHPELFGAPPERAVGYRAITNPGEAANSGHTPTLPASKR